MSQESSLGKGQGPGAQGGAHSFVDGIPGDVMKMDEPRQPTDKSLAPQASRNLFINTAKYAIML